MSTTLLAVAGLEKTSGPFRRDLVSMCHRLGADPDDMAAVMSFESRHTFSPSVRNPESKAVGLIQFTKGAAKRLETTRDYLASLTARQQLEWVEKFFIIGKTVGRLNSLANTYLAVFAPIGMGKAADFVVYSAERDRAQNVKHYAQNKNLDTTGDGTITVAEAVAPVHAIKVSAMGRPRLAVPPAGELPLRGHGDVAPLVAIGFALLLLLRVKKWTYSAKLAANGH